MSIRPVRILTLLWFLAPLLGLHLATASVGSAADYSHARVVRLSLVQGEVKVSRTGGSGDALGQNLTWEQAMVNLPIREGFVLATGQGRTEVEFESGAAAYLAENSVLQFTELGLSSGARITRLTLTQGTATIYANASREDSFVVKTPTLEVTLIRKGRIRVDTYDDGGSVSALHGEADVSSSIGTRHIRKGQALSLRADNPSNFSISSIPKDDSWDQWVADRAETVQSTAAMASSRLSSPYYNAGIADLSVYGTWITYGGYTNCWRPRGVGFAWTPFSSGMWSFYPGFGWTWVSSEPWGWLPYHFGGWVYSPVYGWLWVPGQPMQWQAAFRPATAIFVQVNNHVGWLPMHPSDRRGDRPLNIEHGVLTEAGPGSPVHVPVDPGEKIQVLADAPRGLRGEAFRSAVPPERVPRRLDAEGESNRREPAGSGIVYDPGDRRFVNSTNGTGANSSNGAGLNSNSDSNSNNQNNSADNPGRAPAPRHSVDPPARINRSIIRNDDEQSTGNDGDNPARSRIRVAPPAAAPEMTPSSPSTPPRPSVAPELSAVPSRPSPPENPQSTERPQPPNRSRAIWHDDVNSNDSNNDLGRNRNRTAPPAAPDTMRSMPPPPAHSNFPPPSEPPRSMPAPRVEPMHPPSPSIAPAPRPSPPPPAPRQEQDHQGHGHQDPP
ncbi:MAG TPA: DUF6600 domain-containing protein [Candidatus Dormibacteraeota bacterium]|nr:DUF6600 domain-containing protein [Candidatus Dormibacteraeota bacterium]